MNARQRTVRISPPTNIITYRLEDRMVYVPLASSWKEAIRHARSAFQELANVDEKRIIFSVNLIRDEQRTSVGISPLAWRNVASHLACYEIINIEIGPDLIDADSPPRNSFSAALSFREGRKERFLGEKSSQKQRWSQSPSPTHPSASSSGLRKLSLGRVLQKLRSV